MSVVLSLLRISYLRCVQNQSEERDHATVLFTRLQGCGHCPAMAA